MMKNSLLLTSCLLFSLLSFAQETSFKTERKLYLENESNERAITIDVPKDIKKMHLGINSSIGNGSIIIKIVDPQGQEEGKFSLGKQLVDKNEAGSLQEKVEGTISKSISNPLVGSWKIIIVPTNAKGLIKVGVFQIYLED